MPFPLLSPIKRSKYPSPLMSVNVGIGSLMEAREMLKGLLVGLEKENDVVITFGYDRKLDVYL